MANTVEEIKALFYAEVELVEDLKLIFQNPSQVKIWGEVLHTLAVEAAILEQQEDHHLEEVIAVRSVVYNADWLRDKIFAFQYSATTPQAVTLSNLLVPEYPIINEALQIITVCNLYFEAANLVNVKVAKGNPPVKLAAGELTALQNYLIDGGSSSALGLGIGFTGVAHVPVSVDPDYIWLEAEIFYSGEFADTIQDAVNLAIVAYYNYLEKDGYLRIETLAERILAVDGVTRVKFKNLGIRANGTAFGSKTLLVDAFEVVLKESQAVAGYAYEEITAGEDLATKLTFTAG